MLFVFDRFCEFVVVVVVLVLVLVVAIIGMN
jgi:hypothetical protein